jgi:hypothetical protein
MGASGWIYYVPYQKNLEQALQELRLHVFETKQYGGAYNDEWVIDVFGEEINVSVMQEVVEQEDGSLVPVPPIRALWTIEEEMEDLLRRSRGTHSILDICRVITNSQYYGDVPLPEEIIQHRGTMRPFSSENLIRFFGSEKPTRAEVEAAFERRDTWGFDVGCGSYAIIYQDGAPHEIVFAGASGD